MVPKELFLPDNKKNYAYSDSEIKLSEYQSYLSNLDIDKFNKTLSSSILKLKTFSTVELQFLLIKEQAKN